MALHKLTVIARLVSDPRFQPFANGGGVAKFGLPINFTRPKKNPETGKWEGDSFIIDVDAFNRDNYKLAELVMQYLKKGSQVYVEGRLKPNEYTDRNGVKTFKPVLVADLVEFLDGRPDAGAGSGMNEGMRVAPRAAAPAPSRSEPSYPSNGGSSYSNYDEPQASDSSHGGGSNEDDIPF